MHLGCTHWYLDITYRDCRPLDIERIDIDSVTDDEERLFEEVDELTDDKDMWINDSFLEKISLIFRQCIDDDTETKRLSVGSKAVKFYL